MKDFFIGLRLWIWTSKKGAIKYYYELLLWIYVYNTLEYKIKLFKFFNKYILPHLYSVEKITEQAYYAFIRIKNDKISKIKKMRK